MSIDFFDCPNCEKSLRVGARHCHHCGAVDENDWADPDAEASWATGGYADDSDGDDDSRETSAAFGWPQTLVVIVILLLILSFLLQAFSPQIMF